MPIEPWMTAANWLSNNNSNSAGAARRPVPRRPPYPLPRALWEVEKNSGGFQIDEMKIGLREIHRVSLTLRVDKETPFLQKEGIGA